MPGILYTLPTAADTWPVGEALRHASHASFNVLSLENWLAIAGLADVACIPARLLGRIPTDLPIMLLDAGGDSGDLKGIGDWRQLVEAVQGLAAGEIVRWDCCVGEDVKGDMACGRSGAETGCPPDSVWRNGDGRVYLNIDDPRLMDILNEYEAPSVPVFARPWTVARQTAPDANGRTWPVEFRVYCERGKVIGVSAYYPQAAVEDDRLTRHGVAQATAHAEAVLRTMADRGLVPSHRAVDPAIVAACTLDFLQIPDGGVVLLEGGPPWTPRWGASPCCFGGEKPSGLALVNRGAEPEGW